MTQSSESLAGLAKAMVAAQAEIENAVKNATNPHFRNNYADLAEVINTTRPILTKHGLAVIQMPGMDEEGRATVANMILHESGEWITSTAAAPMQKNDPQGVGSALTYLRRYSLAALCNIAQEDDDGEAASRRQQQPQRQQNGDGGRQAAQLATDGQKNRIRELIAERDVPAGKMTSIEAALGNGLTSQDAAKTIVWLEKRPALAAREPGSDDE